MLILDEKTMSGTIRTSNNDYWLLSTGEPRTEYHPNWWTFINPGLTLPNWSTSFSWFIWCWLGESPSTWSFRQYIVSYPYASCIEYLSTLAQHKSPSHVVKYTLENGQFLGNFKIKPSIQRDFPLPSLVTRQRVPCIEPMGYSFSFWTNASM